MATWGAYLKSYVVKEAAATIPAESEKLPEKPQEKLPEKIPIRPLIVPLNDYQSAQRTIEPIIIQEDDKDGKPAPIVAPNPPNAGRLATLFGYGGAVETKPEVTVAKPNPPEIPKMATIVQQAKEAQEARKVLETPQPAANATAQQDQSSTSRVAKMFGYANPANVEPVKKPDAKPEESISNKVAASVVPETKPAVEPGPSRFAKIFGYGASAEPKIEQTPEKSIENSVPEKPAVAPEQQSQPNASRVAKMFGYAEPPAPSSTAQSTQKSPSNPWEALEKAELEWGAITTEKAALKVVVPSEREGRINISELRSTRSSSTSSSRDRYSVLSSTSSSSRSLFSTTTEIEVPEYVLRAQEAERKRKAREVEQRAEKMLIEQQEMEMEMERMRLEEENMMKEAMRIAQEESEMRNYIQEVGIPEVSVFDKGVQSPKRNNMDSGPPTREYGMTGRSLPGIQSPIDKSKAPDSIGIQSPLEKSQIQDVADDKPLGRTKSRAKERLDRINAEAEAERQKEEEKRLADANDSASDYASVYESEINYDDDEEVEDDGGDAFDIDLYRQEAETARRLEEERIAGEERLEREESDRQREEEVVERAEEERIGELARLKREEEEEEERIREEEEEEERVRLEDEEEKRVRLEEEEKEARQKEEEEDRIRLEEEEARRIEDEQREAERRLKERRNRERRQSERREEERRAQERQTRQEEERRMQAEREELEAMEEAQRIEDERLAQREREEQEREDALAREEAQRIEDEMLARQLREDALAREEAQRIEDQMLAQQQREETQRLELERQRAEYEEEEEEPAETKEEEMRKAEEKIRKAFAGLAAEREGGTTPTAIPTAAPKPQPPANPFRADIGDGRDQGTRFPPPSNRNRDPSLNRAATVRLNEEPGMADNGGGNLARAATTGGTLDRDNAVGNGNVKPRPVIRGGLPGGPRVGLPGGPRVGLPSGPRGGGLPMNPRARRT